MLSTGAQKDTQRVEKPEAFCAVAMVWAEINRGETLGPTALLCSLCRGSSSSRDLQRQEPNAHPPTHSPDS